MSVVRYGASDGWISLVSVLYFFSSLVESYKVDIIVCSSRNVIVYNVVFQNCIIIIIIITAIFHIYIYIYIYICVCVCVCAPCIPPNSIRNMSEGVRL